MALSYRTTVTLTRDNLSIEEVIRIARGGARVEISREALERGDLVYGMNTGLGSLWRTWPSCSTPST